MNYYLTYYSDYYDRKNNHIRLEIYTTNNGLSEEVLLTSDAPWNIHRTPYLSL